MLQAPSPSEPDREMGQEGKTGRSKEEGTRARARVYTLYTDARVRAYV